MGRAEIVRKILAGLVVVLASGVALAAGHAQCQDCHGTAAPSALDLKQSLSGLCSHCHQATIHAGEHVVDVPVVNTAIPLPLRAGTITCVTCHDPHAKGLALRMADPQLCDVCH